MEDEIKEILNYLKKKENTRNIKCITLNERDLLLDYITNLQEQLHQASLDIQELTERDIWCPSNCDKLTNLQKENNSLKQMSKDTYDTSQEIIFELQEELKSANDSITWWTNRFNAVQRDYENYKSRCEKAIEYNYELQERYCHSALFDDLVASKIYEITEKQLNILQGVGKDE